jgi:uncharacterized protein
MVHEPLSFLSFFMIILLSGFVHSSAAFGFSVFAMTLLPLLLPLIQSAAVVKAALLAMMVAMVLDLRKHIRYRFILLPTLAAVFGNTLGFYFLVSVDAGLLKRILGGVLALLGLYMLLCSGGIRMKKSTAVGLGMGFLSGLMGGLFNLGGVVLVLYYFSAIEDKLEYAASMQATLIVSALYGLVLNLGFGIFSGPGMLEYALVASAAALLGTYLGLKVLKKINKRTIGRLSHVYMTIMGSAMAIDLHKYFA